MAIEKRPHKEILTKPVVTKEGRKLGIIADITFETRTGELIHIVIKNPTPYAEHLNIERSQNTISEKPSLIITSLTIRSVKERPKLRRIAKKMSSENFGFICSFFFG